MNETDGRVLDWFYKHKDKILGCIKQNDANWVYNTDDLIDEYYEITGEERY